MGMPPMKKPSSRLYWIPQENLVMTVEQIFKNRALATTGAPVADRSIQAQRFHRQLIQLLAFKKSKSTKSPLLQNALL